MEGIAHPSGRQIRRLAPFARPYKGRIILALFLTVILALTGLAGPALAQVGIDKGITVGNETVLVLTVVAFVLVGVLGWATGYAQNYLSSWIGERMLYDLRIKLFSHFMALELGYHERASTGRSVSRLTSDVEQLNDLVTDGFTSVVVNGLTFIGVVIILFVYDWQPGAAVVRGVPVPCRRHGLVPGRLGQGVPAHPRDRRRRADRPSGEPGRRAGRAGVRPPGAGPRGVPTRQRRLPRGQHAHDPTVGDLLPEHRAVVGHRPGHRPVFRQHRRPRPPDPDRRDGCLHRLSGEASSTRSSSSRSCTTTTSPRWPHSRRSSRSSTPRRRSPTRRTPPRCRTSRGPSTSTMSRSGTRPASR